MNIIYVYEVSFIKKKHVTLHTAIVDKYLVIVWKPNMNN